MTPPCCRNRRSHRWILDTPWAFQEVCVYCDTKRTINGRIYMTGDGIGKLSDWRWIEAQIYAE